VTDIPLMQDGKQVNMAPRATVVCMLSLTIAGCSPVPPIHIDPLFFPLHRKITSNQLPAGSGIILLSTSFDKGCSNVLLGIHEAGTNRREDAISARNREGIGDLFTWSDFKDHHGNVYALILPAGEHTLWLVGDEADYYRESQVGRPFSLAAGETEYLGELQMRGCLSVDVRFRDNWDGVKDTMAKYYPAVDLSRVRMSVIGQ
jgi:hypothetical protein